MLIVVDNAKSVLKIVLFHDVTCIVDEYSKGDDIMYD